MITSCLAKATEGWKKLVIREPVAQKEICHIIIYTCVREASETRRSSNTKTHREDFSIT